MIWGVWKEAGSPLKETGMEETQVLIWRDHDCTGDSGIHTCDLTPAAPKIWDSTLRRQ